MGRLQALIFDQDGVLADTERDGHRVAFNRAFEEFGLPMTWNAEVYGELIHVGGGKERMRAYITREGIDLRGRDLDDLIPELHRRKTDIFMELIEDGKIGLRPGVARLMDEVHAAGVKLAVCSTSNERSVNTLIRTLLGAERHGWFDAILAGDVVKAKKPDPEIYAMARSRLSADPSGCVVVEDTSIGVAAAKGAGMRCLVTVNDYTKDQDFSRADFVVTCLGDAAGERASALTPPPGGVTFEGIVTLTVLEALAAGR